MPGISWIKNGEAIRTKNGWPHDYAPWTALDRSHVAKSLPARHRECLNLAMSFRLKAACKGGHKKCGPDSPEIVQNFFCDIGQDSSMKAFGRLTCLKTRTEYYSFQHDAMLRPVHHLRLHGYPHESMLRLGRLTDRCVRDLAGQSFSLPCVGSVLWALFLIEDMPWWKG